ncbi:MAG: hypothetical protein J6Q10_03725, partial [Clostridia bacterium]|nr:hypothetical protein [Clostridia bacterium]
MEQRTAPEERTIANMALTRKMLKAMGIEEEKIDQIIEAHTETVDALKEKADANAEAAKKFDDVQKELDKAKKDLENAEKDGFKKKYEDSKKELDDLKNEIAGKELREKKVKAFREISPTFSRVFAVYADWSKEAMDAFADYYDLTFRKAGTILYAVPGRLPYITDEDNIDEYCEKVAEKLDYLINERNCTKIRYYCVTNELSVGNSYCWFANHMDLFKQYHEGLYKAFRRHNLNV